MSGFANYSFYLPDGCPQVCGQHRPWLPLPLARGHTLQLWPLPEGGILPVVAREMSCPLGQGPFLGSLGPTQGAYSTCKAPPSLKLGAFSPWGPVPNPIPLWTLASGRGEWREPESGAGLGVCCGSFGTPARSQGQYIALEKETCEYFHWISQAPTKEGAFPGHELASVCVGNRSCTFDLKVILANAEVRDVTVPKGRGLLAA